MNTALIQFYEKQFTKKQVEQIMNAPYRTKTLGKNRKAYLYALSFLYEVKNSPLKRSMWRGVAQSYMAKKLSKLTNTKNIGRTTISNVIKALKASGVIDQDRYYSSEKGIPMGYRTALTFLCQFPKKIKRAKTVTEIVDALFEDFSFNRITDKGFSQAFAA